MRRALGIAPPAGGLVLAYHRVADLDADPQRLAVSPARFAAHLDVLTTRATVMPLPAMLGRLRHDGLPPGAVAITFDDGYADALSQAAPLLAGANVPATMFLTTGSIAESREFWWDELERGLLGVNTLPVRLRLPIGEWDLSGAQPRSPHEAGREAAWSVLDSSCPGPRHRAYLDLCRRLQAVDRATREHTLSELSSMAGHSRAPRPSHRPLRQDEVAVLAASAGITIGAHTVTHPSLAARPAAEQLQEIDGARRDLEAWIGRPVDAVAYPFGGRGDVSRDTIASARHAGMTIGCTTQAGRVDAATDPLRVPRAIVRNWTGDEFARRLAAWTAVAR
jgi:peptidoglycan/xylan/chitin deacetylase (PgdA/CDA1 family)